MPVLRVTKHNTAYAVFKMLLFLADLDFFRWLYLILVSIERINAAQTVKVRIGRGSFCPNFIIDPIPILWSGVLVLKDSGNLPNGIPICSCMK